MADASNAHTEAGRPGEGWRHFADASGWVTPSSLRPGEIEALAERYADRSLEELLGDRAFRRLSEEQMHALAAEFRRRAERARAQAEAGGLPPRRRRRRTTLHLPWSQPSASRRATTSPDL